jgi:hypothetical protein
LLYLLVEVLCPFAHFRSFVSHDPQASPLGEYGGADTDRPPPYPLTPYVLTKSRPLFRGSSLLLASAFLLLAFLALLLLTPSAGKPAYEALRLVGYTSYGVLRSLRGLTSLVGHLTSALLLALLLVLLASSAALLGLGGARRLLSGLRGLGRGRYLQVEKTSVLS